MKTGSQQSDKNELKEVLFPHSNESESFSCSQSNLESSTSPQKNPLNLNGSEVELTLGSQSILEADVCLLISTKKDLSGVDFLQEAQPKQSYSNDMFDSQTFFRPEGSITLTPVSTHNNSTCVDAAKELPDSMQTDDTLSSKFFFQGDSEKKSRSTPKPVFKKPTNSNSAQVNKNKKVPVTSKNKEPSQQPTPGEIKENKTPVVKGKVGKENDPNWTNKKSSGKNQKQLEENQSLSKGAKSGKKLNSSKSRGKVSTEIVAMIKGNSVEKSEDDCGMPLDDPESTNRKSSVKNLKQVEGKQSLSTGETSLRKSNSSKSSGKVSVEKVAEIRSDSVEKSEGDCQTPLHSAKNEEQHLERIGNKIKNGKSPVKDKTKKENDLNAINKKSQGKSQKPKKEKQSLIEEEISHPKYDNVKSRDRASVKKVTARNSVKKSENDRETPFKRPQSPERENSRKRTAEKMNLSETTIPRKSCKRAKNSSDISPSQIITLAVSKANETGCIPKYVKNRKLNQKEQIQALHKLRNVGVWIQCCNSKCSKWRYVDEIKDPICVPRLWYCKMNSDPDHNACDKAEQVIPTELDDVIENSFTAGSMVWARVAGYPYWPAMVEDDPELEQFYWLDEHDCQKVTYYHVTFFDSKGVTRAWVPAESVKPFTELESRSTRNVVGKHAAKINEAKTAAFEALEMDNADRLAKYSFIARYTGPIKKKKIGLSVPDGIYDSSDSELDCESQNRTDSDFSDNSSALRHLNGTVNDSGLEPSNSNSNTYFRKDSDLMDLDYSPKEGVSSLHIDLIATELQDLKSVTSHFDDDGLFNEVTSSQDFLAPTDINHNEIPPVIDNMDDSTVDCLNY